MSRRSIIFFSIGNPGPMNRHSVGHYMMKQIMTYFQSNGLSKPSPLYSMSSNNIFNENEITFVKSNTYMNVSNQAWNKFKLENRRLLNGNPLVIVLYDDFENKLPGVKLSKFKKNESHNGLKSIKNDMMNDIQVVENNETGQTGGGVYLLGVGIGPKPLNASREVMSNWVLSQFKVDEKFKLETESTERTIMYIDELITRDGVVGDVGKFNSRMTKLWKSRQNVQ